MFSKLYKFHPKKFVPMSVPFFCYFFQEIRTDMILTVFPSDKLSSCALPTIRVLCDESTDCRFSGCDRCHELNRVLVVRLYCRAQRASRRVACDVITTRGDPRGRANLWNTETQFARHVFLGCFCFHIYFWGESLYSQKLNSESFERYPNRGSASCLSWVCWTVHTQLAIHKPFSVLTVMWGVTGYSGHSSPP